MGDTRRYVVWDHRRSGVTHARREMAGTLRSACGRVTFHGQRWGTVRRGLKRGEALHVLDVRGGCSTCWKSLVKDRRIEKATSERRQR